MSAILFDQKQIYTRILIQSLSSRVKNIRANRTICNSVSARFERRSVCAEPIYARHLLIEI